MTAKLESVNIILKEHHIQPKHLKVSTTFSVHSLNRILTHWTMYRRRPLATLILFSYTEDSFIFLGMNFSVIEVNLCLCGYLISWFYQTLNTKHVVNL